MPRGIVLAYTVNELPPDKRRLLLDQVGRAVGGREHADRRADRRGGDRLVDGMGSALADAGAARDEWRFQAMLPALALRDCCGRRPQPA